jgi:hypothetical protein
MIHRHEGGYPGRCSQVRNGFEKTGDALLVHVEVHPEKHDPTGGNIPEQGTHGIGQGSVAVKPRKQHLPCQKLFIHGRYNPLRPLLTGFFRMAEGSKAHQQENHQA